MDDNSIMPFGKYKGKKLSEISDGYLLKLYDAGKTSGALKAYIEDRIPVLRSIKERLQRDKNKENGGET
jgi:uncharacterized protein (DUF3820 family)